MEHRRKRVRVSSDPAESKRNLNTFSKNILHAAKCLKIIILILFNILVNFGDIRIGMRSTLSQMHQMTVVP